jgi:twitching motility protein PilT
VTLLDSLLDAILRLDGEALVMHTGEKPYVVLTSRSKSTFRGPLAWGQVELSSRPLTADAVLGMLAQMLSVEQSHMLDELGAIEQEIDAPGDSGERFVVTAARGGHDVWVEVRRRVKVVEAPPAPAPVEEPLPAVVATPERITHGQPESAMQAEPESAPHGFAPAEPVPLAAPEPVIEILADEEVPEIRAVEEDVHEIAAIEEDLSAIVGETSGSSHIFEIASMPEFTVQTEASRLPDEDEQQAGVFEIEADGNSLLELEADSSPVFGIAPRSTPLAAQDGTPGSVDPGHSDVPTTDMTAETTAAEMSHAVSSVAQPVAQEAEPVAREPEPVADAPVAIEQPEHRIVEWQAGEAAEKLVAELAGQKVMEFAERKVGEIAPSTVARVAEESVSQIAGQTVSEAAGRKVGEIAEQTVARVAEQKVGEIAEHRVGAIVGQEVTRVAEERVAEIAGPKVTEVAHLQVADIVGQRVNAAAEQRVGAIAEQKVGAIAEHRVDAIAEQHVTRLAEERVAEIAGPRVTEVARQQIAEIAGQAVSAAAEQKVGEIAQQVVAGVAEQEVTRLAEDRVAEIAEQKVTEAARQQVAEIAGLKVAEAAEEKVAEIAEQTVGAIAEQKVGEVADRWIATVAERKLAELAEQRAAEIAAEEIAPAADPQPAAEAEAHEADEADAIPPVPVSVVVPHTRPAFRVYQPPPPLSVPAASEEASLVELLRAAAAERASTVYAVVEMRPMMRVEGQISLVGTHPSVAAGDVERFIFEFAPRDLVADAAPEWTCTVPGVGRVRCVTFRDHSGAGLIFHLPAAGDAGSADEAGIPAELQSLCGEADGLIVVAGPRSSGKSMLLSAFVDLINRTRYDHVITIESQIRRVHEKRLSFVSQREVRGDGDAIAAAARAALREGPDVLVIEDLRAPEALTAALDAARAGRLVFGSISARTAPAAVQRLIDAFPADRRPPVRASLAGSLRAVITQLLVPKTAGGRIAARELLLSSPAVRKLVLDGAIEQLSIAIESGRSLGMRTMVDSLGALVREGVVEIEAACACAPDRAALISALERDGIDVTGVERRA